MARSLSTNEGHTDRGGVAHQPMVVRIAARRRRHRRGPAAGALHHRRRRPDRSGVRHNLGLESLTRTPDGRLIERPRTAAGAGRPDVERSVAAAARGWSSSCRHGDSWTPGREWAYALDPTPRQTGYRGPCQDGENGLSELYALDDTRFIALERACLVGTAAGPAFNPVRLNLVDVDGADDVSSRASLAGVTTIRVAASGCCST